MDPGRRLIAAFAAHADVLACIVATIAAWVGTAFPPGDLRRVVLVLPVLLFIPGYLLMQATAPLARTTTPGGTAPTAWQERSRDRRRHALAAFGVSPALAGLVSLATALAPTGFRLEVIANAILVVCVLLATGVLARRIVAAHREPAATQATARAHHADGLPRKLPQPGDGSITGPGAVQFIAIRPPGRGVNDLGRGRA